jgi:cellobiose phosphorylase
VERYAVEPYVLAADVYGEPPHAGRGGWTWYTGSAAWLYRMVHEVLLGIDRQGDTLRIRPRVPAAWQSFTLHYRYARTFYHLGFTQDAAYAGPVQLSLDGAALPEGVLRLVDDQVEHAVAVRFGPVSEES